MTTEKAWALNTLNGVVSEVDPEFLKHPTLGANLVEVNEPSVCIGCGDQPDTVVTTEGDEIVIGEYDGVEDTDELLGGDEPEPERDAKGEADAAHGVEPDAGKETSHEPKKGKK